MSVDRATTEAAIDQLLLQRWNPLGIGEGTAYGAEYLRYAHEIFALLARGASDVQIARHLHRAERDELQHPELVDRDLTELVRALRTLPI